MKKNKTIWLLGGFGNVLFHLFYAFLLRQHGFNVSISPILTESNLLVRISGWTVHKPIYERFSGEYESVRPFWGNAIPPLVHKKLGLKIGTPFINNKQHFIPPIKDENLFGYFQNKDQIAQHKTTFIDFCMSISKLLPEIALNDCVVHFRGGDSLIAKSHTGYYRKVKYLIEDRPVTIVTDSMRSAKEFFGLGKNIRYLSSSDPFVDFVTLANAKVIFCGPSTFSWWAMHISMNAKNIYIPQYIEDNLGNFRNDLKVNILLD